MHIYILRHLTSWSSTPPSYLRVNKCMCVRAHLERTGPASCACSVCTRPYSHEFDLIDLNLQAADRRKWTTTGPPHFCPSVMQTDDRSTKRQPLSAMRPSNQAGHVTFTWSSSKGQTPPPAALPPPAAPLAPFRLIRVQKTRKGKISSSSLLSMISRLIFSFSSLSGPHFNWSESTMTKMWFVWMTTLSSWINAHIQPSQTKEKGEKMKAKTRPLLTNGPE